MDLHHIDRISATGRSWLHRAPVAAKMVVAAATIGVLLLTESTVPEAAMLGMVVVVAISAGLPIRVLLPLMLYPVLFLAILFLSVRELSIAAVVVVSLRVLAITATVVVFFLSTSYPAVFGTLSRFTPGFLVAALFFTYRSVFVISDSINDARVALHLRGGLDWRLPLVTLRRLGSVIGHVMVHAIDSSQRMADGLTVRGFSNKIYYLGDRE